MRKLFATGKSRLFRKIVSSTLYVRHIFYQRHLWIHNIGFRKHDSTSSLQYPGKFLQHRIHFKMMEG